MEFKKFNHYLNEESQFNELAFLIYANTILHFIYISFQILPQWL